MPHLRVRLAGAADMAQEIPFGVVVVLVAHGLAFHQRSFSVERPTRTSIIVMIQNRTTTWFSFQPFSS